MNTIGPFIVQKNTQAPLFWCILKLDNARHIDVRSVHFAPFTPEATTIPPQSEFLKEDPKQMTLHAFHPETSTYATLYITREHTLKRFRPKDYPRTLDPYVAEHYTGKTWIVRPPLQHADSERGDTGYIELRNTLEEPMATDTPDGSTTLASLAVKQFQAYQTQTHPTMDTWHQTRLTIDIKAPANTEENALKGTLMQRGFFGAWDDLKAASSSQLTYCYALIFVLGKPKNLAHAYQQICHEEETIVAADALKLFLHDEELYLEKSPLTDELFKYMQGLLVDELKKYQVTQEGSTTLSPAFNTSDLHSLKGMQDMHAEVMPYSRETSANLATALIAAIANPLTMQNYAQVHPDKLRDLHILLLKLYKQELIVARVRHLLEIEYHNFELGGTLDHALQLLLERVTGLIRQQLHARIQNLLVNLPEADVMPLIAQLLHDTHEIRLALSLLPTTELQCRLIDALRFDDIQHAMLQTAEDAAIITKDLDKTCVHHIFKKRSPSDWGALATSAITLKTLSMAFGTADRTKIFNAHAARFAGFVDSNEGLFTLLAQCCTPVQLSLLLMYVPSETMRHIVQTPDTLHQLLTLPQTHLFPQKVRMVLSAIPGHYAVTALINTEDSNEQARMLLNFNYSLCRIYLETLSPAAWTALFPSFLELHELSRALVHHNVFGTALAAMMIGKLPTAFVEKFYDELTVSASTLEHPRPWRSVQRDWDFEALKQGLHLLLRSTDTNALSFFAHKNAGRQNEPLLLQGETLLELKKLLLKSYCLQQDDAGKHKIRLCCLLIQDYEQQQQDQNTETTNTENTDTNNPSGEQQQHKRARLG